MTIHKVFSTKACCSTTCFLLFFFTLAVPSQNQSPRWPMFRKHSLDGGANESATVADVNRDGRLDIIAGENWFEAPEWKRHRLREIPFVNGYIDDLSNAAMDVNADGYPDVIASAWFAKKISWYENPRRHDGNLAGALWKEHVIETNFNYELFVLVDVDGDGKALEILPNYGSSGEIAWFERAEPFAKGEWVRHRVGQVPGVKGLHGIGAGDLNGDNRPDIITARGWFEAPANSRTEGWTFHADFRLLAPVGHCSPIYVQDVNGDGRRDVVYGAGHDYGVFWAEQITANRGAEWKTHTIDDSWSQAHAVTLADIDKDGRLDIITGKRYLAHDIDPGAYEPLGLYWYRLGEDGRYTKHVIDYNSKAGGGMQLPVIDIDGDGDLDIVAPGKSGLFLFEQIDFARQKIR
ncbi:MAG: VCBS repeat-containing protein [Acidobacteriota bacterium]|nr:VCBS repeat-containing protein [Acidobacteriota bacterium]